MRWRERLTQPLTPREHARIRVALGLLPIVIWLVVEWGMFAVDISPRGHRDRSGHIKGHDFIHFYVLGEIGLERATGELYRLDLQSIRNDRLVPEEPVRYLPIHSPQVALFFAPVATLPYVTALLLWLLSSTALYAACCATVWRTLPELRDHKFSVVLCAAALPAFYSVVAAGQTSVFALAWFTLAYIALRHDRQWLAGLCFGMLVYKPTLGLVLPFALLYSRQWKAIAGAVVAVIAQFAIVYGYFGWPPVLEYAGNFQTAAASIEALEAQPWQMHSLRSFFTTLLPWPSIALLLQLVFSIAVVVFAARTWKTSAEISTRFAVLLIATVLVSPHVYTYELVVLIPALLIAASRAVTRGRDGRYIWLALYASYILPGIPGLATATHLQWSVPALAALMMTLGLHTTAERATHRSAVDAYRGEPITV